MLSTMGHCLGLDRRVRGLDSTGAVVARAAHRYLVQFSGALYDIMILIFLFI